MNTTAISSVIVLPVEERNILKMVWNRQVTSDDVSTAFHEITALLDKSSQQIDIIVDIRQNPNFPLQTTISETLRGPFNHPKMGKWLVIGSSLMAKVIANVLINMGQRDNILWFDDEDALNTFLEKAAHPILFADLP